MNGSILVAPNAFKGSVTAAEAAAAIARGLAARRPDLPILRHPVADGGDGTGELLIERFGARWHPRQAADPLGRQRASGFGYAADRHLAVVELADCSGLRLLKAGEENPLRATSFGTGMLIRQALDVGARHVLLCLGGSATVDGGLGILRARGMRFRDSTGREIAIPDELADIETMDTSGLDGRLSGCRLTLLCDVETPLLGASGAASFFGPQKGADVSAVARLEKGLARFAALIDKATGQNVDTVPRGGAAGGMAAALHGLLRAELVSGAEYFLDITDFDSALAQTFLVVTGEGALDAQTLAGKAPHAVAKRTAVIGVPTIALAGRVPPEPDVAQRRIFTAAFAIGDGPSSLTDARAATVRNLERVAGEIAGLLTIGRSFGSAHERRYAKGRSA